jgi:2-polyprenyl-6-methoxyphenol hydroxylase-like FAD-dependent oxidoreductase
MRTYDVVVVGGRVAGASTALLLARAGLRVALLDRGRYGSDTLSTHGLMRAGVLRLSRWGVLPAVVAAGTPPVRRTVFHYTDAQPVQVTIRPGPGVPALFAPRRHLLDRLLVDAAAEAGVEVRHETTVTALLHDGEGAVRGVVARGPRGRESEYGAAITVGADGIRSLVAQTQGAVAVRSARNASAVLYRYHTDLPVAGYEWYYAPAGEGGAGAATGLLPTNDGQTAVFVSTTPVRMRRLRRAGAEAAFASLLAETAPDRAGEVAAAAPASRMHGFGGVGGFMRQSYGPGWALIGDAGYFKDPITAHGMTDALRDAELLADAVLEALGGGVAPAVALGRYQAFRDRLSRRLFEVTDAIAGFDWDTVGVQGLLRELSSAMSDEVDHLLARMDRGPGDFSGFVLPDTARARQ